MYWEPDVYHESWVWVHTNRIYNISLIESFLIELDNLQFILLKFLH